MRQGRALMQQRKEEVCCCLWKKGWVCERDMFLLNKPFEYNYCSNVESLKFKHMQYRLGLFKKTTLERMQRISYNILLQ